MFLKLEEGLEAFPLHHIAMQLQHVRGHRLWTQKDREQLRDEFVSKVYSVATRKEHHHLRFLALRKPAAAAGSCQKWPIHFDRLATDDAEYAGINGPSLGRNVCQQGHRSQLARHFHEALFQCFWYAEYLLLFVSCCAVLPFLICGIHLARLKLTLAFLNIAACVATPVGPSIKETQG